MKQFFLALSLSFFLIQLSEAQESKNYKGGYTFNNLRGIGDFDYYLTDENEPVLNGKFLFEYKKLDSLSKTNFLKLEVEGNFKAYQKDQNWKYKKSTHRVRIEDIVERTIQADLDTRLIDLMAQYQEGKLEGRWDYMEKKWEQDTFVDVFKTNTLRFDDDKLIGEVRFESAEQGNAYQIFGQLDEKGLMDGNWDFFYTADQIPIHETRRYESGFLIGLSKVNSLTNEKIDEVVFFNAIEKLDSLNQGFEVDYSVSEEFFGLTFNDGFAETSEEFQEQYRGTYLLEDALLRILQFEQETFVESDELIKSPISTRRFAYEVSEEDKERYQQIILLFDELKDEANRKSRIDFLSLNQNTSDSLSYGLAYFEYLRDKLSKFDRVMDLLRSEDIRFYDPSNYLRDGLDFLDESEEINYSFRGNLKTKVLDFSEVEKVNMLGEDLLNYLKQEYAFFEDLNGFISIQQQSFRQDKDLEALESRVLSEKGLIDSVKSSLPIRDEANETLVNAFYENLAVQQYQSLLDEYNQTEEFLEKANKGDELIELLQFVRTRLPELSKYSSMGERLKSRFTEKTLDPFTFETEFEVLRQAVLVESAQRILAYELQEIKQTTDFNLVRARLLTLDELENRLLELQGRNTKRLERNLNQSAGDINQLKKLLSL